MSENSGLRFKVIGIILAIVLVLGVGGGLWYFLKYKPDQEAKEKARLEQIAKEEAEKKRQEVLVKNKAKYKELIDAADLAVAEENWEEAKVSYVEASSLFPSEQYPKDQLVLVNEKLDEIAEKEARRAAGIIETISSATGRFYVIVSSSIDDDLALDYAKKLSLEGNNVKIVQHNAEELPFYGVSLGDYASWDDALAASESFNGSENSTWVLKY